MILVINRNQTSVFENIMLPSYLDQNVYDRFVIIDDGSLEKHLNKMQKICDKYSFDFIKRPFLGVMDALSYANNICDDEWIIVCQSDVSFPQKGCLNILLRILNDLPPSVGTVGVNVLDDGFHSKKFITKCKYLQQFPIGIVGRSNLAIDAQKSPFVGWYRGFSQPMPNARTDLLNKYDHGIYRVEVVSWHLIAIRKSSLDQISIDKNFNLLLSFDDISYQMMMKGYSNVVISSLTVYHQSFEKKRFGIPNSQSKINNIFFTECKVKPNKYWENKWGFPWGAKIKNVSKMEHKNKLQIVNTLYKGSLLAMFSKRRLDSGPDMHLEI